MARTKAKRKGCGALVEVFLKYLYLKTIVDEEWDSRKGKGECTNGGGTAKRQQIQQSIGMGAGSSSTLTMMKSTKDGEVVVVNSLVPFRIRRRRG